MCQNILYIWGAGASAQALPVVNEIYDRMKLRYELIKNSSSESTESHQFVKFIEDNFEEMIRFRSFDTYAKSKFLHYKNSEDDNKTLYWNLKGMLSYFLSSEECLSDLEIAFIYKKEKSYGKIFSPFIEAQLFENGTSYKLKENLKDKYDSRYQNFIIDIYDGDISKIKIYSWNYDSQFRKAFEILGFATMVDHQSQKLIASEKKLNGDVFDKEIKFAWEDELTDFSGDSEFLGDVSDVIVIGYSFPFSNRKIDSKYLNADYFGPLGNNSTNNTTRFHIQTPSFDDFERSK